MSDQPTRSETPRLDALLDKYRCTPFISGREYDALIALCRQLERELRSASSGQEGK